jgi:anti-sigma B factor antagonist
VSVSIKTRAIGDVEVVELGGRITLGEATGKVREAIRDLVSKGHKKILLNLGELKYMDSAGLGEMVGAFTTVTNQGGQLKLVNVTGRALDLLQVTKLTTIFEFYDDEETAVRSFQ